MARAVAATSSDGLTWTERTLPVEDDWSHVAYGNSIFCAVTRDTNQSATSADGVTWSLGTGPGGFVNCFSFENGYFIAVTTGSNTFYTSTDGTTWVSRTFSVGTPSTAIRWNGTVYTTIRVNTAGTNYAMTSADLVTWTLRSMATSGTTLRWRLLEWNGSIYTAISVETIYGTGAVTTSTDGISWVYANNFNTPNVYAFTAKGTLFCAARTDSRQTSISSDGNTWTNYTTALPAASSWECMAANSTVFCCITTDYTQSDVATSPDGITWTAGTLPHPGATWNSITSDGSIFVAVATVSVSGITVTPDPITVTVAGTQQCTATVVYTDASSLDITSSASWYSTSIDIGTISSTGLLTGVAEGSAYIYGAYGSFYSTYVSFTVTGEPIFWTDYIGTREN